MLLYISCNIFIEITPLLVYHWIHRILLERYMKVALHLFAHYTHKTDPPTMSRCVYTVFCTMHTPWMMKPTPTLPEICKTNCFIHQSVRISPSAHQPHTTMGTQQHRTTVKKLFFISISSSGTRFPVSFLFMCVPHPFCVQRKNHDSSDKDSDGQARFSFRPPFQNRSRITGRPPTRTRHR